MTDAYIQPEVYVASSLSLTILLSVDGCVQLLRGPEARWFLVQHRLVQSGSDVQHWAVLRRQVSVGWRQL